MRININSRITIVALVAVMAAMTGVASATEMRTYTNPNPFYIYGSTINESAITINPNIIQTPGAHVLAAATYPETISLRESDVAKGTTDGTIILKDNEDYVNDGSAIKESPDARTIARKPEVPIVALPIAAVIGIVFFFKIKNIKEE